MNSSPQPTQVVLQDAPGPRVLGMRVGERNARVAARAGASVVKQATAESALYVPADVVLEASLFDQLPSPEKLHRLLPHEGSAVAAIWGPSEQVEAFARGESESERIASLTLVEGALFDASTPEQRARSGRTMLLRTVKPTDGFVSRHLNRRISRFFSRWFMLMRLRPNHGSFVSFLIGVATAWFLAQPGWLNFAIGGVLFQFASIFDGVDGEMARVSVRDSKFGAKVDTAVDNFTYIACLVGFAVGWIRDGISPLDTALVVGTIVAILLTLFQVLLFVRRYAPTASFVFLDTCVRRAAARTKLPTLRLSSGVFHALRRDLFSLLLMFVTFSGSRQTVLWLAIFGLFVANFTLIVHRKELVEAAAEG